MNKPLQWFTIGFAFLLVVYILVTAKPAPAAGPATLQVVAHDETGTSCLLLRATIPGDALRDAAVSYALRCPGSPAPVALRRW